MGLTPGSGRSLVEAWQPIQYSCLGSPTDRGASQATVHSVAESEMAEVAQHMYAHIHMHTNIT